MPYPTAITTLTAKVDLTDTINATDVNSAYTEIGAIETTLGTGILFQDLTTTPYSNSSSAFVSVHARLSNIERGLRLGVGNTPYVRTDLASTITALTGTVTLSLKNVSGNTANLFETYVTGTSTLGFRVSSAGTPYVNAEQVVVVNDANYNTIKSDITSLQAVQAVNPLLLTGM